MLQTFRIIALLSLIAGCSDGDAPAPVAPDVAVDTMNDAADVGVDLPETDTAPDVTEDPRHEPDVAPTDTSDTGDDVPPDLVEPECVPKPESCDGFDNDCDALIDEADDGSPLTDADPENCGACDDPCLFGDAAGRCVAGACVLDACAPGTLDLDGNGRNGCETRAGKAAEWRLETGKIERVVDADPWYFVLDGRVLWMYLAGTGELVDHVVLPGAFDGAWHADRSILVVAGRESVSVVGASDSGLDWLGFIPGPRDELMRVAVHGDYAYVANDFNSNGDSRLWVVDISDPSRPVLAHQEGTLRGTTDVEILPSGHLMTVSVSIGLAIYSLEDPVHPFLLSFDDRRSWPSSAVGVDFERGFAYVARENSQINVFDISDPLAVRKIGIISDRTPNQSTLGIHVDGQNLWTADLVRVRRFDVTDPTRATRRVLQDVRGAGQFARIGGHMGMVVYDGWGNTLNQYSVNAAQLHPLELLNSRALIDEDVVLFEGEDRYGVEKAFAIGEHVLTVTQSGEMALHRPELVDGLLRLGPSLWRDFTGAFDVAVDGNTVYGVTGSQQGNYYSDSDLVIWRMENADQGLTQIGRGRFSCGVNGIVPYDLSVAGDRAYVMCGSWQDRRVETIDISDETTPVSAGALGTAVGAFHATSTADQLVLGSQRQVFYRTAVQFSGYQRPVADTSSPAWRHDPGVVPTDIRLHGSILYLWSEKGELDLLDIGFPDGFTSVEDPALPGNPLASYDAPPVSGPYLVMPTAAGVTVLGAPDGRDGPSTAPRVLGSVHPDPIPITGAAILPQGAILLEQRRVVTVPFERD